METQELTPENDPPTQASEPDSNSGVHRDTSEAVSEIANIASVVFIDHTGKRFLFPYESCKAYSSFRNLLEQTYARADEEIQTAIREENYDLLTIDDEIILPTVWDLVIKNPKTVHRGQHECVHTVKISFRTTPAPPEPEDYTRPIFRRRSDPLVPPDEYSNIISEHGEERRGEPVIRRGSTATSKGDLLDDEGSAAGESASRIRDWRSRSHSQSRSRSHSRSRSRSRSRDGDGYRTSLDPRLHSSRRRSEPGWLQGETPPGSTADFSWPLGPRHHHRRSESVSTATSLTESIITDSGTSTETEDEERRPVTPLPPFRDVIAPVDSDGNRLAYMFDTQPSNEADVQEQTTDSADNSNSTLNSQVMMMEGPLKILKAIRAPSGSNMKVEIHPLHGPETPLNSPTIGVRWYHLYGDHLDFVHFKSVCVGVHGLSSRMRRLVTKTLEKIEEENLQPFLDGLFIEPGTVIRGDDSSPEESQSVTFSCVPYFELRAPSKTIAGTTDRLHSPRTLMQALYPYEPVQDRDMEQAFRKFKSGSRDSANHIIHVPCIWLLNIGSHGIVTSGYHKLTTEFAQSIREIAVIRPTSEFGRPAKEKILSPFSVERQGFSSAPAENKKDVTSDPTDHLTNVRVTDWAGRVLLYTLNECRSYFQVEQKLRELRNPTQFSGSDTVQLLYDTGDGHRKIRPGHWVDIISKRDRVFVDVSVSVGQNTTNSVEAYAPIKDDLSDSSVLPFFYWVYASKDSPKESFHLSGGRPMHCLEQVERAMTSEVLDGYETEVDQTFTSTAYYKDLPQITGLEKYSSTLDNLARLRSKTNLETDGPDHTPHQSIVDEQCSNLTMQGARLADIVSRTVKLFVQDVDHTPVIRKLWGAMTKIATVIEQVHKRRLYEPDPKKDADLKFRPPLTPRRAWYIRPTMPSFYKDKTTHVRGIEKLNARIFKCKKCRNAHLYTDQESATIHLLKHMENIDREELKLNDFVRSWDQWLIENSTAKCVEILTQATGDAYELFLLIEDLVGGVKGEDGKLLELYTFPHELLKTLQRLLIYYFAVERALFFTHESKISTSTKMHLSVLRRFYESAKTSILAARKDLCNMARSKGAQDIDRRLPLSAEYICSWFLSGLLVRSLDNNMTVAELYRQYLSTLQFQVYHRPNKRLLRSINLLQEELTALQQVNSWQAKFIYSYSRILDDSTYQTEIPSRKAMYPYERSLLDSCLEDLSYAREDYAELIRRCGPLQESTKQSSEINEEDHGKAILVFTLVTTIFLPLSFVTSYLGMNTSDIRDMDSKQTLFFQIALPLTAVTMGSMLFIAYKGDSLRTHSSSLYRRMTGKQTTNTNMRGISVAQRKRVAKSISDTTSANLIMGAELAGRQSTPNAPVHEFETRAQLTEQMEPSPRVFTDQESNEKATFTTYTHPSQHQDPFEPYARARTRRRIPPVPPLPNTSTYANPFQYDDRPERAFRRDRGYGYDPSRPPPPPPPPLATYNRTAAAYSPYDLRGVNSPYNSPYNPPYNSPYNSAPPPTYVKVHRRHLDADTLAYYDIPWEYDSLDPEYYIILRYMDPAETAILFEHTRRLRTRKTGGSPEETMPHKKEYLAWVRRKNVKSKEKEFDSKEKEVEREEEERPAHVGRDGETIAKNSGYDPVRDRGRRRRSRESARDREDRVIGHDRRDISRLREGIRETRPTNTTGRERERRRRSLRTREDDVDEW